MEGWKSYLQDPAPGNSLIGKANPQMGAEQIAFGIAQMKQYQLVTGGMLSPAASASSPSRG